MSTTSNNRHIYRQQHLTKLMKIDAQDQDHAFLGKTAPLKTNTKTGTFETKTKTASFRSRDQDQDGTFKDQDRYIRDQDQDRFFRSRDGLDSQDHGLETTSLVRPRC